ncbi:hypothetical protein [Streptomyces sp. S1D4-20]|uniref:hypothetical protein n=1 Tax=Streptomyces sp. S1D4-20 TaxID=2594462 RepID=UPI0011645FBD|nr:hypothetical protein [Streptomyces sp. S1D4-20]QDN57395.1 hypothetical protein FNV67_20435 [Streptomyces sp. S1D4-20]
MPEAYPTPLAGQRLTAALLRSMQPLDLRKTSDTPRPATTTTTVDPHLQFTAEANAVYTWNGWIRYDGPTAGDLIVAFVAPTGAFGSWGGHGVGSTIIGATSTPTLEIDTSRANGYMLRVESNDVTQLRTYGCLGVGNGMSLLLSGTLRVGSTAGTWGLSWAQSVSNAAATTLFTDSYISVQRIA